MSSSEKVKQKIRYAIEELKKANYVTCLTGAGISVESGIRPFRGPGGLWTEKGEPPMDGYMRFLKDPETYWKRRFGKQNEFGASILSSKPNPGHFALAELEQLKILRSLITQNIDNLHLMAGSKNVIEIHGNRHYLRCIECSSKWHRDTYKIDKIPPTCPKCGGIIKSDTVMFGEPIPNIVLTRCFEEAQKSDCMIVVGTSATVTPAANLPLIVRRNAGTLIEINIRESQISHICDINIYGPSGKTLPYLVQEFKLENN